MSLLRFAVSAGLGWAVSFGVAGCSDDVCNCPSGGPADLHVSSPCDRSPQLAVSGPCDVYQGLNLEVTATGSCHVQLTHDDGTVSVADIAATREVNACGSDPTGCGYYVSVSSPSLAGGVLPLGSQTCASVTDGGGDAAGDAARDGN